MVANGFSQIGNILDASVIVNLSCADGGSKKIGTAIAMRSYKGARSHLNANVGRK